MNEEEFKIMKENLKQIDVRKSQREALKKIVAIWKMNIYRKNAIEETVNKVRLSFETT